MDIDNRECGFSQPREMRRSTKQERGEDAQEGDVEELGERVILGLISKG